MFANGTIKTARIHKNCHHHHWFARGKIRKRGGKLVGGGGGGEKEERINYYQSVNPRHACCYSLRLLICVEELKKWKFYTIIIIIIATIIEDNAVQWRKETVINKISLLCMDLGRNHTDQWKFQKETELKLEARINRKKKMKFNWKANWEILLVLVIIVIAIVITTIAAIRNKGKLLDGQFMPSLLLLLLLSLPVSSQSSSSPSLDLYSISGVAILIFSLSQCVCVTLCLRNQRGNSHLLARLLSGWRALISCHKKLLCCRQQIDRTTRRMKVRWCCDTLQRLML